MANRQGQAFYLMFALIADLRTGLKSANLEDMFARPQTFVSEQFNEFTPTYIRNDTGQLAIFDHSLDIQILKREAGGVVLEHQPCTYFVEKIKTRIAYFFMNQSHFELLSLALL